MKILQESDWMVPINEQKGYSQNGIGKTPTVRIGMTTDQIRELVERFSESPHFHPDKRYRMDKLLKELDGKAGAYHNSFHLPMTFTYDDVYEFDSSGDRTGKHEPGFHLSAYTWGYNYRTDRRVTKYERGQHYSIHGLGGNTSSGRFTLSLILRHGTQQLEEEVPCLYELLHDWILNKDEYKPIDWHSEEYPWNWKVPTDEVEA